MVLGQCRLEVEDEPLVGRRQKPMTGLQNPEVIGGKLATCPPVPDIKLRLS